MQKMMYLVLVTAFPLKNQRKVIMLPFSQQNMVGILDLWKAFCQRDTISQTEFLNSMRGQYSRKGVTLIQFSAP